MASKYNLRIGIKGAHILAKKKIKILWRKTKKKQKKNSTAGNTVRLQINEYISLCLATF